MTKIPARQYLLRLKGGELKITDGPFTPYDDEVFEAAFVKRLKEHPWDLDPEYRVLLIDEKGCPEIEDFMSEYVASLLSEAWEDIPQQIIGRLVLQPVPVEPEEPLPEEEPVDNPDDPSEPESTIPLGGWRGSVGRHFD